MDPGSAIVSTSKPLGALLALGRFEPASVQREFQWGAAETERLLDDLLSFMRPLGFAPSTRTRAEAEEPAEEDGPEEEAVYPEDAETAEAVEADDADGVEGVTPQTKPPPSRRPPDFYFLGAIILNPSERAEGLYRIYDGLQRLSTLSILLAVLRDGWGDPEAEAPQEIDRLLKIEGRRRLEAPSKGGSLARILNRSAASLHSGASNADGRLAETRDILRSRLALWTEADRAAFLEMLLGRVIVTETVVANRSSAYQIFVGANARGKRLDLGDVLKGKLVELIDRPSPGSGQRYANDWTGLQRRFRDRFTDLLKDAEFLRYKDPAAHHPGELIIADIDAQERAERDSSDPDETAQRLADEWAAWIDRDLKACGRVFARIRAHLEHSEAIGLNISLRRLSFLEWGEWRPVAMAIMLKHRKGGRDLAARLRKLQQASYILELADWDETGRREIAAKAVAQIEAGRDPFEHLFLRGERPDYGALRLAGSLRDKAWARLDTPLVSASQRGAITRWVETLYWGDRLPKSATDAADVEHVLPQALKDGWETVFDVGEHERWRHRLGNLCIISKSVNMKLQTAPWAAKRAAYQSLGGRFRSAEEVAGFESWTPAEVARRHSEVLAKARKALGLRRPKSAEMEAPVSAPEATGVK